MSSARESPTSSACAGGWLFDRVMAGWDVTVAVPHNLGAAPLRILGVRTVALDALVDSRPATRALAVAGPMCNADDLVRDVVGAALSSARTEVTLWGDAWIPALGSRGAAVRHELSSAARVFKAQAVSAAAEPTRRSSRRSRRSSATAGRFAPTTRTWLPVG